MSALAQKLMTVDEFLATADQREGRWELEDGVAYEIEAEQPVPAEPPLPNMKALEAAIARAELPCSAVIEGSAVRVTAGQPVPAPIIIIEVGSTASRPHDEGGGLIGYFSLPSVAHYLLLCPKQRAAVHHKRAEGGLIETRIISEVPLRLDPPGLDLELADLFPPD